MITSIRCNIVFAGTVNQYHLPLIKLFTVNKVMYR